MHSTNIMSNATIFYARAKTCFRFLKADLRDLFLDELINKTQNVSHDEESSLRYMSQYLVR